MLEHVSTTSVDAPPSIQRSLQVATGSTTGPAPRVARSIAKEVNEMKQEEALAKMLSKLVDDYVEAADVFGDAMAEMETTVIYHHDDMDMKIRVIVSEPNEEEESEGAE